jgi:hypothetical protein
MQSRHDELVEEMLRRGYKHKSPYEAPDLSAYDFSEWSVDVEESIRDLKERCPECMKRIIAWEAMTRTSEELNEQSNAPRDSYAAHTHS